VTFLLDVNVLIALIDPTHVSHGDAHRWFGQEGATEWAIGLMDPRHADTERMLAAAQVTDT
jgi:hypothetical protein